MDHGESQFVWWYVCLVVATTMILHGYDSSTLNAVQGSKHRVANFNKPSIHTAYNVGGIIAGEYAKLLEVCDS